MLLRHPRVLPQFRLRLVLLRAAQILLRGPPNTLVLLRAAQNYITRVPKNNVFLVRGVNLQS